MNQMKQNERCTFKWRRIRCSCRTGERKDCKSNESRSSEEAEGQSQGESGKKVWKVEFLKLKGKKALRFGAKGREADAKMKATAASKGVSKSIYSHSLHPPISVGVFDTLNQTKRMKVKRKAGETVKGNKHKEGTYQSEDEKSDFV
jgi:hypothetical protein